MEKVRPWCGQASDRGRLKNRTMPCSSSIKAEGGSPVQSQSEYTTDDKYRLLHRGPTMFRSSI